MKVLIVHNNYGKYSGEEAVVDKMADMLTSHGHEVAFYRRTNEGVRESAVGKIKGFLSGIYSPSGVRGMWDALRRERPDIVNVHNLYPFISPAALFECKKSGVPVVMTIHNFRLICPTGLFMRDGLPCEVCVERGNEWSCVRYNCECNRLKSIGYTLRNVYARWTGAYRKNVAAFACITEYVPFGKIISSRLGKMLDKQKNVGVPCKYLRNINVRWFSFDLSDLQDMKIEESEFEKYTICKNDLVICEGGEPGRCAVWEKDETIFYQKALHRVRFTVKAEPRLYMYYLWYIAQNGLLNKFYTGTGIKHLTGQSLEKIPVPITDIEEQKRLLELIELRLSVCDSIEKTVDAALAQADAMQQSILKQAFEAEKKV